MVTNEIIVQKNLAVLIFSSVLPPCRRVFCVLIICTYDASFDALGIVAAARFHIMVDG